MKDCGTNAFCGKTNIEILNATDAQHLEDWSRKTTRSDIKRQVQRLDHEQLCSLWETGGTETFAHILAVVDVPTASGMAGQLTVDQLLQVMPFLTYRRVADIVRGLPAGRSEVVQALLPETLAQPVRQLLEWPSESAGANMSPSYSWLLGTMTVDEAIEAIRNDSQLADVTSYLYVLSELGELVGVLSYHELIKADPDVTLDWLANPVTTYVSPLTDREEAVNTLYEQDIKALPVVDDGVLQGVITAERAAQIMTAELTEDPQKMSPTGDMKTTVKKASVWTLYRTRVGWLVILVFGNVFSGAGIAYYGGLIQQVVSLVFFLPLLIDSGGNAGSQSATLMIRAIATGQVHLRDWTKMLLKELTVALLLGLTMAAAVSVLGFWRGGAEVALVVSLTMIMIVLVGGLIGMSLPFILTKLGMDPASASAPLVTTICDGTGVVIYFFIASQLLL